MNQRTKVVLWIAGCVGLITTLWFVHSLCVALGIWQPIVRPKGVSSSAVYVSLLEDATWFDCTIDVRRDVNICKAWSWTGQVIADGEFRLETESRAATKKELRPSLVQGTNGVASRIYLFGEKGAFSKALIPIPK